MRIRIALRTQLRYKWFTLINLLGLSLGIVCSLIILIYVDGHLSTDAHHNDAGRICRVVLEIETPEGSTEYEEGSSLPMADALVRDYSQVEAAAFCMKFYTAPTITVQARGKKDKYKEADVAAYADNGFLTLFDHQFLSGDKGSALVNPLTAVLSEKQAFKYFGTTDVVGRVLNINNNQDLTVTGVFADQTASSDFAFDLLVSLPTLKILNPNYQDRNFTWVGSNNWTFVKLRKGTALPEMNRTMGQFSEKYLGPDLAHWHFHFQPLAEVHFDPRFGGIVRKSLLWVLIGVALALLVVVSVNYINLSVAQSQRRAKEIGIRKFLGGSRRQIFLQFMLETGLLVLVAVGLAVGAILAVLPGVNNWLQTDMNLVHLTGPDKLFYLLLFATGLTLLAGYYPAVLLSGFNPVKSLTGRVSSGFRGLRFRKVLISFQYVIAFFFLTSTIIIIDQVKYLARVDTGFTKEAVITLNIPRRELIQLRTFRDEVAGLPQVTAASLQNQAPMSVANEGGFIRYDNRVKFEDFLVRDRWADDRFVPTYDLNLVAGRNIVLRDSTTEVLVNEALLKKLGIDRPEEVLNKSIFMDNSVMSGTIVGVVRDFHHRSLQSEIEPVVIYPFPRIFNQLGIRLSADRSDEAIREIEDLWARHFPDDVFQYAYLDDAITRMYRIEQVTGKLMSVFSAVSIVICLIGILGLSVFSTLQRTREIGIRKVLGASATQIITLLSREYTGLFAISFLLALPLIWLTVNRWLEDFAYHISPGWPAFVLPGLLLVGLTLALIAGQSLKSALRNPAEAVKES